MKELDPIVLMASIPHMLAVANKVPVANVKGLVACAKAKPETLTYGSTGPGTIQRRASSPPNLRQIAGIKLVHVAYHGAPETMTAILAGEIDMTINGVSNIAPHLGATSSRRWRSRRERSSLAPDTPAMQEAGVPGSTASRRLRAVRARRNADGNPRKFAPTWPRSSPARR